MLQNKLNIFFLTILVVSSIACAAPTVAGTEIFATEITLNAAQGYIVTGNPAWSDTVEAIHGFTIVPSEAQTVTIDTVQVVLFPHKIINQSNTADMETITWNTTGIIPADWSYEYTLEDQVTTIDPAEIALAGQASFNFYLKLTPLIANHSTALISFGSSIDAVKYTGFNGIDYGGYASTETTDNIVANVTRMGLNLTAYLEGYYDYATGTQQPATINVQFRDTKNVDAGVSYNIALDNYGQGTFRSNDIATGNYYICVRQVLDGQPLAVNHIAYVSDETIEVVQDVTTTINISDSLDVNSLFLTANIPVKTGVSPMTNIDGKYQLKGGDANADGKVNVVDIVAYLNQVRSNTSDQRGELNWSEQTNYNGDALLSGADFSVWSKNKGQYIPLPEDDE